MPRWRWLLILTPLWVNIAVANIVEGDAFVSVTATFAACCFVLASAVERRTERERADT